MNPKKQRKLLLKIIIRSSKDGKGGCHKDGMGGAGTSRAALSPTDAAAINPFKNAYYKRMKAVGAMAKIAKLTGLGK